MRIDHRSTIPLTVRPTADRGVYQVQSRSNKATWHRVDVETLQCDCASAMKGQANKMRRQNQGRILWEHRCPHIGLALVTYALLHLEAQHHHTEPT